MGSQIPKPVVQERYERLVAAVNDIAWAENSAQVDRRVEVLFADGEGRKDAATSRMSGRAKDNRLVHVTVPDDPSLRPRPGDIAEAVVTYAAPHHLNADAGLTHLRRTRGGNAWEARRTGGTAGGATAGTPALGTGRSVSLGMPSVGTPLPLPAGPCG
jgi:tRNA-2-methylthio-N6-dimethylallyladenosine synthase